MTHSTDLEEKIARAICRAGTQSETMWQAFVPEAQAALSVIREGFELVEKKDHNPSRDHDPTTCAATPQEALLVAIFLQEREDGGLRVWSDQEPGLILSGHDPRDVGSDIWPAIKALQTYRSKHPLPNPQDEINGRGET